MSRSCGIGINWRLWQLSDSRLTFEELVILGERMKWEKPDKEYRVSDFVVRYFNFNDDKRSN